MSDTSDAIESGSVRYVWVAAIEGYDKLLCTNYWGVIDAWAGYDWATALGGLRVTTDLAQSADPWKPFETGGSRCTLTVVRDGADDSFAIAVARRIAPAETILATTLDRNDTTADVLAAADFASSGELHIGTECIAYTGKTATTFTGLTRGRYSPFGTANGSIRFAQDHIVSDDDNVMSRPLVTSTPRSWLGRRVGVWMHKIVDGLPVARAQAVKVFAGRIAEIRDDPESMGTIIELKSALDEIGDAIVGREGWTAKVTHGIFLIHGIKFQIRDTDEDLEYEAGLAQSPNVDVDWRAGSYATVVVGADPTNTLEIEEGYYTLEQLINVLNRYLQGQAGNEANGGIIGRYRFDIVTMNDGGYRVVMEHSTGLAATRTAWQFTSGGSLAVFEMLGFRRQAFHDNDYFSHYITIGNEGVPYYSLDPPLASYYSVGIGPDPDNTEQPVFITEPNGTFVDSTEWLPGFLKERITPDALAIGNWGVFVLGNSAVFAGRYDPVTGRINASRRLVAGFGDASFEAWWAQSQFKVPYDPTVPEPTIRQIHMIEGPFKDVVSSFLYSTGTSGYNHDDYDQFPRTISVGVAGELLSFDFDSTIALVPGAYDPVVVLIDKPTRFSEVFGADFLLRRAFMVWGDEAIEARKWQTPTTLNATVSLTEANKAAPGGAQDNPRIASIESTEWQRPLVKVLYSRDYRTQGSDNYASWTLFEDPVAIADVGGDIEPETVKARNTYGDALRTGASIEALTPLFAQHLEMFSRPGRKVSRSIAPTLFGQLVPGDIVLLSDDFARDPETGERGISGRPAVVIRVRYSFGGDGAPLVGETDLYFTETAVDRYAEYVPSADVDDTYNGASYSAGYLSSGPTLRTYVHRYTAEDEGADVWYFNPGDKIRIIERDPVNPDDPVYWDRIVDTVVEYDLTLTAALSSPAWDATRKYRIVSQGYAAATATQQTHVYQADDSDGRIVDLALPFEYGTSVSGDTRELAAGHSDIEIVPESLAADGMGRDVGTDYALAKVADNLIDYKTAFCAPMLWSNSIAENGYSDNDLRLVDCRPIFLGLETLTNTIIREIAVAPLMQSADGTPVTCRVSLCRVRPNDTTLVNVVRGAVFSEATFTTTSMTWTIPSTQYLDARVKQPLLGVAYIVVELGYGCRFRGLARFQESVRTTEVAWLP